MVQKCYFLKANGSTTFAFFDTHIMNIFEGNAINVCEHTAKHARNDDEKYILAS